MCSIAQRSQRYRFTIASLKEWKELQVQSSVDQGALNWLRQNQRDQKVQISLALPERESIVQRPQ